ncbi:FAA hydrolase family protein [Rhodobacteraceae bacterium RKSG542]|uniref:fumarylacetoacetate hydrolase family protein n=1 Tax=Pseudovibrio flavus TaxID=2529854 RepID=UPI0012BBA177|nr:fumarylacetoacetate hydrolase family protein [Pseudovibrio flavus]MTI17265.1 FAA hydrolase family protein [Pseudovibrio flavus]
MSLDPSSFVFKPAPVVGAPVKGTDKLFPVRRVYCVGRNYAAHAIEMGHDPDREPPFFFQKNPDNLDFSGAFPYPPKSSDVHHEVELVVALGRGGKDISPEDAPNHIFGYAVGLDMTRRDLQGEMKKAGRPWEIGKAFERSAPMGAIVRAEEIEFPASGSVELEVNGELKQQGDLNQLIWKLPEMISYLSQYFELAAGDLIFTGTPAGVGPVSRGDVMRARIAGIGEIEVKCI